MVSIREGRMRKVLALMPQSRVHRVNIHCITLCYSQVDLVVVGC